MIALVLAGRGGNKSLPPFADESHLTALRCAVGADVICNDGSFFLVRQALESIASVGDIEPIADIIRAVPLLAFRIDVDADTAQGRQKL